MATTQNTQTDTQFVADAALETTPQGGLQLVVIAGCIDGVTAGDTTAEVARDASGRPAIVITTDLHAA